MQAATSSKNDGLSIGTLQFCQSNKKILIIDHLLIRSDWIFTQSTDQRSQMKWPSIELISFAKIWKPNESSKYSHSNVALLHQRFSKTLHLLPFLPGRWHGFGFFKIIQANLASFDFRFYSLTKAVHKTTRPLRCVGWIFPSYLVQVSVLCPSK